jgi:hypothetical protein
MCMAILFQAENVQHIACLTAGIILQHVCDMHTMGMLRRSSLMVHLHTIALCVAAACIVAGPKSHL